VILSTFFIGLAVDIEPEDGRFIAICVLVLSLSLFVFYRISVHYRMVIFEIDGIERNVRVHTHPDYWWWASMIECSYHEWMDHSRFTTCDIWT
jgi:hypothetical protein